MRLGTRAWTRGVLLGGALLAVSFFSGPLHPIGAKAMLSTCRSDPQVTLSNGAVIDLQAGIEDSASDVQEIVYVLHAPAGTHVLTFSNTDGLLGLVERFEFYADDAANTYDTYTRVTTGTTTASVTATSTVLSALGVALGAQSVNGWNGQYLRTTTSGLL